LLDLQTRLNEFEGSQVTSRVTFKFIVVQTLQFEIGRLEREKDSADSQIAWLTQELQSKNDELLQSKKEKVVITIFNADM
jgi:hypothetical protein